LKGINKGKENAEGEREGEGGRKIA